VDPALGAGRLLYILTYWPTFFISNLFSSLPFYTLVHFCAFSRIFWWPVVGIEWKDAGSGLVLQVAMANLFSLFAVPILEDKPAPTKDIKSLAELTRVRYRISQVHFVSASIPLHTYWCKFDYLREEENERTPPLIP
jgi:hypothetical protein